MQIIPQPIPGLVKSYRQYCVKQNINLTQQFSFLAIIVFGLHLIHHFRFGMDVFSPALIPYTVLYSFNILYAIVNLLVMPQMRDVPALSGLTVLLEISYPFFMGVVVTLLAVLGLAQNGEVIPFVAGMFVLAIMLQGHYLALLFLLFSCLLLISFGIFYNLPLEQAAPKVMICFTVVVASAFIARLSEIARIEQFERINELSEKNQLLVELSNNDPLTQIFNRKHFEELLDEKIALAMSNNLALGLILINVDNFKWINHKYGYKIGDQILVKLAILIKDHLTEMDICCRYDGDEFSILLCESNTEQAIKVGQQLLKIINEHDFEHIGKTLTVSIGHSQFRAQSADKFIQCGEAMLAESKRSGKNRVTSDAV